MDTTFNEETSEQVVTGLAEKEITGPFILSCSKCRTIVGDSFSVLKVDGEMRTITLTAASNIQRSADVYTSKEGLDVGSTYFRFTCAMCQNPLGLYYLTTSKDLDDLREKFSFSYESVTLYELGKAQHGVDNPLPVSTIDSSERIEDSASHTNGLDIQEPTNREEIGRIKHVLAGALAKIVVLETSMHNMMNFIHHRPPDLPHTPQSASQVGVGSQFRVQSSTPQTSMPRHHDDTGQKRFRS